MEAVSSCLDEVTACCKLHLILSSCRSITYTELSPHHLTSTHPATLNSIKSLRPRDYRSLIRYYHLHSCSRNPGGIRFGSAELYDVVDMCFAPNATHQAHAIADCLAVGQHIAQGTDERVIMFVKLLEGETLSDELVKRIKQEIRSRRTPRHVPCEVSVDFEQTYSRA